jgi:hypothetical protein
MSADEKVRLSERPRHPSPRRLQSCSPPAQSAMTFAELEKSGLIDGPTFQQILEMDDEEDFSRQIVFDFFEQAETTFKEMDDSL